MRVLHNEKNKVGSKLFFSWKQTKIHVLVAGLLIPLLIVVCYQALHDNKQQTSFLNLNSENTLSTTKAVPLDRPVLGQPIRQKILNTDVIWEAPADGNRIRGILFLAHGCHHSHTDFWVSQPIRTINQDESTFQCAECLGLPEEIAIVHMAVHVLQLVVVTMSSINRENKCWSSVNDSTVVASVLKKFQDNFNKNSGTIVPIYAFGVSSGGKFVSQLTNSLVESGTHLNGYISQVAAPISKYMAQIEHEYDHEHKCAVYITMNRDTMTNDNAIITINKLNHTNSHNVDTKHIRLPPLNIHSTYFSERIPDVSNDLSNELFTSLLENNFLELFDASTSTTTFEKDVLQMIPNLYYLNDDPRDSDWRSVIVPILNKQQQSQEGKVMHDTLVPDESPISEVMNVAYGMHEISRDGVHEALEYCLSLQPKA